MKSVGMLVLVGLLSTALWPGAQGNVHPSDVAKPVLVNTCLITRRFPQLVDFYQRILSAPPKQLVNGVYAEFPTGAGVVAIFSAEAQEKYIPGSAEPATNKSVILEFKVANVDDEFARLQGFVKTWVKPPTNQPWGTRSFYFRDPDGNLIDFYAPVKAESMPR